MSRTLLLVILAVFAFNGATAQLAEAQTTRRPRLFQRIKQDLLGQQQATAAQRQAEIQKAQKAAAARQQQLRQQQLRQQQAQQNGGRVPTPVTRNSNTQQRTPTQRTPTAASSYQRQRTTPRAPSAGATPARSISTRGTSSSAAASHTPATRSQRNGFGFQISLAGSDRLVASSIERNGNAAEAGLRRGDQIIEIGGIEASTVEEFDEISKIMGQGDEMEFKIRRSGKVQTLSVRYGQLPKLEDVEASNSSSVTESNSSSSSSSAQRYDFAPPRSSGTQNGGGIKSSNSVLSPTSSSSTRSTIRSSQAQGQIEVMGKTIREQNLQIEKLQQELRQLRRSYGAR